MQNKSKEQSKGPEYWAKHIRKWKDSGLSKAEYARISTPVKAYLCSGVVSLKRRSIKLLRKVLYIRLHLVDIRILHSRDKTG